MDLSTPTWRKSSHSSGNGGDCVEVARINDTVAIRDSKDPEGPKLLLPLPALASLTRHIKNA
ncbi:DUF397 domain-containing protein [Actinomadura syzygii]|uniref:DUF397 domain-containing protein n=1 Tax=Actinomadura syzygii TaxID=1427538 RepID=A0A5D0U5G8_9ACTN|nr:DUF397 domain-containing protein [Actinomadura syzygii]TYC13307.1 DUF397 domain-containing protein [Actinomadura syzygii]